MVATTYKLDQYRKECRITPFVLDTGETQIVIAPPTGEAVLDLTEATIFEGRRVLMMMCGQQFEAVWDVVKDENGEVLVALLADLAGHFKIAQIQEAPGGRVALPS
jgi:hypothetical protein